ncbi:hypothetical protein A8C32_10380 [Flavivirga aquatica]|uniref:DUF6443 domain-containing protein n=2 Tax=Flavivirga aquatica TaxID=1849968 RepID=A0A1E5TCL4_9FLAO|nr:hypothetical protein A8C32_10380 [Flavivirga aquatica]
MFLCSVSYAQNTKEFDALKIDNALLDDDVSLDYKVVDANSLDISYVNPMTYIALSLKQQTTPSPIWYTFLLTLEVTPALKDDTFDTANKYQIDLEVEYNNFNAGGYFADISKHVINKKYGASIKVLESRYKNLNNNNTSEVVNGSTPDDVLLTIGFDAKRYDRLDPLVTPSLQILAINSQNELPIKWGAITGAKHYDLEWAWVDSYADNPNIDLEANQINFSTRAFELNNTRIQTTNTEYTVPLIYAKGYLVFRVRAVGYYLDNLDKYLFGRWSTGHTKKQTIADWGAAVFKILETKEHQINKNWQFQASYAEEGKKKEVVSYFDGTLRNRQTVTKINSDNNAIVGEVIYDAQGRPAIEVLPVPTNENEIKFYKDFNKSTLKDVDNQIKPYTYTAFDLDTQNELDTPSNDKLMDSAFGAAKYYSSNNDINDAFKERIANAEQYPFSQIEYTPDNTGRIRRKSGVGKKHQLGGEHDMEYYYGTPEQKELNRLFGYSVGNAKHYKKNLVLDPNRQASISYIDPQGRTIATALSGHAPSNVLALENEIDAEGILHKRITTDLLNKNAQLDSDTTFDLNIAGATGYYSTLIDELTYANSKISAFNESREFKYTLTNNTPYFKFGCVIEDIFPLLYDLQIDVLDKNSKSLLDTPIQETVNLSELDNNLFEIKDLIVSVPRGSYRITKKLVVNKDALDDYANMYVELLTDEEKGGDCYIPKSEVNFLPPIEFDGCFETCADCEKALLKGLSEEEAINNYADKKVANYDYTALSYLDTDDLEIEKDKLWEAFANQFKGYIKACNEPCLSREGETVDGSNAISCQVLEEQLLNDMKPFGQYGDKSFVLKQQAATNNEFVEENISQSNGALSIFNENNELFSTKKIKDRHDSWRNPSHPGKDSRPSVARKHFKDGHYYNVDGTISYVRVKEIQTITKDPDTDEDIVEISYNPEILNGVEIISTDEENTGEYFVEPQYLAHVSDFLSADIWQDNWAYSLLYYHPEYTYLEYAKKVCANISTVNGNRNMNSDGYDIYLQGIETYEDAKKGPLLGLTTIADSDPYFKGTFAGFSASMRKAVIKEALESNFDGSERSMMNYTLALNICNSLMNCTEVEGINSKTSILGLIDSQLPDDQERFWKSYRSNYFAIKQRVQTVFANIYAYNRGDYNGAIGKEPAPISLISIISDYNDNNVDAIEALIQSTNNLDDESIASQYKNKTKRFVPVDHSYNSGAAPKDVLADLKAFTDREYYIGTGVCPLGRDLELYLGDYFKNPERVLRRTGYDSQYMSISLFEDLGGTFPSEGIDILPEPNGRDLTITLEDNETGEKIGEHPVTISLPVNMPIEYGTANWDTYGENNWVITKISNFFFDNNIGYNAEEKLFSFKVLARIQKSSADINDYKEIILDGTTQARVGKCSLSIANGIGQFLVDTGSTSAEDACTTPKDFQNAILRLMYTLERNEQINQEVNLNDITAYNQDFLLGYFGETNLIWKPNGSTYTIEGTSGILFSLELEEPINPANIRYITAFSLDYEFDEKGYVLAHNASIAYRRMSRPRSSRRSIEGVLTNGGEGLINLLCCGDINDSYKPDNFECAEKKVSCSGYEEKEKLFEQYFLDIFNYGITNGTEDLIELDDQLRQQFVAEFYIVNKLKKGLAGCIDEDDLSFGIDTSIAYLKFSNGNPSEYIEPSFKILFPSTDSGNTNLYGFLFNLRIDRQEFSWSDIDEMLCSDYVSGNDAGSGIVFNYRINNGDKVLGRISTHVTVADQIGSHSPEDYSCFLYACDLFVEPDICEINNTDPEFSTFETTFSSLVSRIVDEVVILGQDAIPADTNGFASYNLDIASYPELQSFINSGYPLKQNFEYAAYTYKGLDVIHSFDFSNIYCKVEFFFERLSTISVYFNDHYSLEIGLASIQGEDIETRNLLGANDFKIKILREKPVHSAFPYKSRLNYKITRKTFGSNIETVNIDGHSSDELRFISTVHPDDIIDNGGIRPCVFFNASTISEESQHTLNIVREENSVLVLRSLAAIPSEECDENICVPKRPVPISCTEKYPKYEALMTQVGVEAISELAFCEDYLAYLVDDYEYYLEKSKVLTSTEDPKALDLNYMSIQRFGATAYNYGYSKIRAIIDLYVKHVEDYKDNAKTWAAFTADYLIEYPECVPSAFPVSFNVEIDQPISDCEQFKESVKEAYLNDNYDAFINTKKQQFIEAYLNKAVGSAVETFGMKYEDKEYQYTLYYYDQAGNLLQTVPPEGVDRFTDDELDSGLHEQINAHRAAKNDPLENAALLPDHNLITEYRYNSLNQLVWQKTPDGGVTRFAYDELGRIIASQNAKQEEENTFSYTAYDELGRIIEAGELQPKEALVIDDTKGKLNYVGAEETPVSTKYKDRYPYNVSNVQVEVTKTAYSNVTYRRIDFSEEIQALSGPDPKELFETVTLAEEYTDNTRNRVSAVYYFDSYDIDKDITNYDNAIFYHYDIHGNVSEIAQHNKVLAQDITNSNSGIKRVVYNYDLISGNVNRVTYQNGRADQFIHSYEYDADNRIVNVKTSGDGMNWEEDATYQYFSHGPLARTELGDKKVQGLDYAYTLQGWLKGVNADQLVTENDLGKDGTTGSNVAKDAMGFALSYYDNDYTPIGDTGSINAFLSDSNGPQNIENLYNGNIKQMTSDMLDLNGVAIGAQRNHYQYDQLNRIKEMQGYNAAGNKNYSSTYAYDKNGNLEHLTREGIDESGKALAMDNFNYKYHIEKNQENKDVKINNRLLAVQEVNNSLDANFSSDIDFGQILGTKNAVSGEYENANYQYDAIGQLISDAQEGITNIKWRVDGKVASITKANNTEIHFKYDGLGNRIAKTVLPKNKTTVYTRDAQGNVLAVYETNSSSTTTIGDDKEVTLKEHHIYGSSRLGIERKSIGLSKDGQSLEVQENLVLGSDNITTTELYQAINSINVAGNSNSFIVDVTGNITMEAGNEIILKPGFTSLTGSNFSASIENIAPTLPEGTFVRTVGDKRYELSNHLGNVLSVVSDRKLVKKSIFTPDVLTYNDYYPFGQLLPNRHDETHRYRYGFQGQEKDDEVKGEGNSYDYGARFHDPRVGRWLSLDAVSKSYQGNYNFASNSPIMLIDKGGDDDYYYDAITNSIYVIRNGAPHRFFFTEHIFNESENGLQVGQPVVVQRPIHDRKVKELFYNHNNVFRDALKHAPRDDYGRIYNAYRNLGNEEAAKGAAILASPLLLIVGMEVIASEAATTFLINEAKDELLSQATGGATDYIDLTKMTYKGLKNLGEFAFKRGNKSFSYDELKDMSENQLDFSTGPDEAVFWSGNRMFDAQSWAKANEKLTLELTPGGRFLDNLQLFGKESPLSGSEAAEIWDIASDKFSKGASGNLNVFSTGANRFGQWGERTWWRLEKPNLMLNVDVKTIFRRKMNGDLSKNGHIIKE